MTVYSGDAQKVVAMADNGSFVSIDFTSTAAKVMACECPGPVLTKIVPKKSAGYKAIVALHDKMLRHVKVFEFEPT